MYIVARLKSKEEIEQLYHLQVDAFSLDTVFSVKKIALFDVAEIKEILHLASRHNIYVYLNINKMMHESDLLPLENFLKEFQDTHISGIVINDLTVFVLARKLGLGQKIIFQPGTMNTDSYSAKYFAEREIRGITLSREITLDEIETITEYRPKLEYSLIGHGYLDMFYSKRRLLTNYFIHKGIQGKDILNNHHFRLNEEMRAEEFYPIVEDEFGTHVFRSKKLISIDEIDVLKSRIDDFFIERLFLSDEEYYDSIRLYRGNITKEAFLKKYNDFDSGFYYRRTEKRKGDLDES